MSAPTAPAPAPPGGDGSGHHVRAVARGGAYNVVGSVTYGVMNFVLLFVLTNELGAKGAGPVIVAIAVFTIMSRIAELGASTGLIRMISRDRALGRVERIRPTLVAAVVPVLTLGVLFAVSLWLLAPFLAQLFSAGEDTDQITRMLRVIAPFLPFSATYFVLVLGTRGFDTMKVQVSVEKMGRATLLPIVVFLAIQAGGGPVGAITAWAATSLLALAVTIVCVRRLLHGELTRHSVEPDGPPAPLVPIARSFWTFTLPRSFGQTFNVAILWFDTLFVAALIGATQSGIYAAGTRYLLIGTFIVEAMMQAVGPRVSGLLTLDQKDEAREVVRHATTWQAAVIWPIYLLVGSFAAVLLGVFGPDFVQAEGALVFLAAGIMASCLAGPCDSVILMSGRSRQSLINSAAALAVNIVGNLILVPRYGITAAGAVWALTLLVAAGLPAIQSARSLGIVAWSRPLARTLALSLSTVGLACVVARVVLGDTWAGLLAAALVGLVAYSALTWRLRGSIHLQDLLDSFRRRPPAMAATTTS